MDHSETVVAVVHIGEPHQEVAGGLLGFVEPSGVNEFAHGVGGGRSVRRHRLHSMPASLAAIAALIAQA